MTKNIRAGLFPLTLSIVLCTLALAPAWLSAQEEKPFKIKRENQRQAQGRMGATKPKPKPAAPKTEARPRHEPRHDRRHEPRHDRRHDGHRGDHGYRPHHPRSGSHHYHSHRRYAYPYHRSYPYLFYRGPSFHFGYHGRYYPHSVPYYVGEHPSREMGALDIDLRPDKAEVYIDGQRIGVADNFDGFPSYLWLEKGTYDVVFYLQGYRTIARQYSIYPGVVIDVNDRMESGESVRPEDLVSKSTEHRDDRLERDRERQERAERRAPPRRESSVSRAHFSIWPEDAAVYLDGNFLGTGGEVSQLYAGLIIEPGEHLVEVVHPAFDSQERSFSLDRGGKIDLEIELTRP